MSRIAIVAHCHHPIRPPFAGGIEAHTDLVARRLVELGHEVTVLAKGGTPTDAYKLIEVVPETWRLRTVHPRSSEKYRQLALMDKAFDAALQRVTPDQYDYVINNSLNRQPLRWKTSLPQLTIFHTPIIQEMKRPVRWRARDSNQAFVSVSEVTAREWRPYAAKASVIHNGVDLKQWQTSSTKTDALCWAARITPEKGLHVAIAAARLAGRPLLIAGPISDTSYFAKVIKPQLGGDITYVGHLDHEDLSSLYATSAVMVVSSLWNEPFGLSAVEAMASGTPVAALPHGAISEVVSERVGKIADDDSGVALASAIESAALLNAIECRTEAEIKFDSDRMVNSYIDILMSLLA